MTASHAIIALAIAAVLAVLYALTPLLAQAGVL